MLRCLRYGPRQCGSGAIYGILYHSADSWFCCSDMFAQTLLMVAGFLKDRQQRGVRTASLCAVRDADNALYSCFFTMADGKNAKFSIILIFRRQKFSPHDFLTNHSEGFLTADRSLSWKFESPLLEILQQFRILTLLRLVLLIVAVHFLRKVGMYLHRRSILE